MISMNTQNRNRLIDAANRLMAARGEEHWGLAEKGDGMEKRGLVVTNYYRDVKCSIGDVVNHTVVTVGGARWVLDIPGSEEHFVKCTIA